MAFLSKKTPLKTERGNRVYPISDKASDRTKCLENYLKEVGSDELLIKGLEKVPFYPAENIYEAILAWNFVMYLDNCDNIYIFALFIQTG